MLTAGVELPLKAIREQIASAFDLVVQVSRLVDGTRRITHVTEVLKMESDVVSMQDLFLAKPVEDSGEEAAPGRQRLLGPDDLHRHPAAVPAQALGQRRAAAAGASSRPRLRARAAATPARSGGAS